MSVRRGWVRAGLPAARARPGAASSAGRPRSARACGATAPRSGVSGAPSRSPTATRVTCGAPVAGSRTPSAPWRASSINCRASGARLPRRRGPHGVGGRGVGGHARRVMRRRRLRKRAQRAAAGVGPRWGRSRLLQRHRSSGRRPADRWIAARAPGAIIAPRPAARGTSSPARAVPAGDGPRGQGPAAVVGTVAGSPRPTALAAPWRAAPRSASLRHPGPLATTFATARPAGGRLSAAPATPISRPWPRAENVQDYPRPPALEPAGAPDPRRPGRRDDRGHRARAAGAGDASSTDLLRPTRRRARRPPPRPGALAVRVEGARLLLGT